MLKLRWAEHLQLNTGHVNPRNMKRHLDTVLQGMKNGLGNINTSHYHAMLQVFEGQLQ